MANAVESLAMARNLVGSGLRGDAMRAQTEEITKAMDSMFDKALAMTTSALSSNLGQQLELLHTVVEVLSYLCATSQLHGFVDRTLSADLPFCLPIHRLHRWQPFASLCAQHGLKAKPSWCAREGPSK
eukprot:m.170473 g.170473  ORF g.170473 m.170473 type:complete len:128 (-) comp16486_c1_seq1:2103-2486(-)